jgi:hypothetical protein
MTTRKNTTAGKSKVKRPKLKRETIKDLDVKARGREVRGGVLVPRPPSPVTEAPAPRTATCPFPYGCGGPPF